MKTALKIGIVTATIVTSLLVLDSCKSLCCGGFKGLPSNLISADEAVAMRRNYQSNIAPLIQNSKGKGYQATEFVWIDYQTLKQYVALLDEVNNVNEEQVSGVRIYFAQHLSSSDSKSLGYSSPYPGRETVFLAPTTQVGENELSGKYSNLKHIPFTIAYEGSNPLKGDFMQIDGLLNESDSKMASPKMIIKDNRKGPNAVNMSKKMETSLGTTSLIMDHLAATPPPKE